MLLLGPILLGLPHLVSHILYVPKLVISKSFHYLKLVQYLIAITFILAAALRFFAPTSFINSPNVIEIGFSIIVILALSLFFRFKSIASISSILIILGIGILSFHWPLYSLSALIIVHNFIGFFFWISNASLTNQKSLAISALFIFLFINVLIFNGFFDVYFAQSWIENRLTLFNDYDLGFNYLLNTSEQLFHRFIVAFAFGQGVHYFIWLKAIPEQNQEFECPTNWKISFRFLKKNLAPAVLFGSLILICGLFIIILLKSSVEARMIYVALAALHGYLEIATLPFLKFKASSS